MTKKNNKTSNSGVKFGIYFPKEELELLEFAKNQNDSLSKVIIKALRKYREDFKKEVSNEKILEETREIREELKKIKDMIYYQPIRYASNDFLKSNGMEKSINIEKKHHQLNMIFDQMDDFQ